MACELVDLCIDTAFPTFIETIIPGLVMILIVALAHVTENSIPSKFDSRLTILIKVTTWLVLALGLMSFFAWLAIGQIIFTGAELPVIIISIFVNMVILRVVSYYM